MKKIGKNYSGNETGGVINLSFWVGFGELNFTSDCEA